MAIIRWSDKYSVNVAEIDQQHKKLIEMLETLNAAMRQGKGKTVLGNILNGLIAYSLTHFKTEETFFDQFDYPEALAHKNEHASFVDKVLAFKKEYQQGKVNLSIEIMQFLSDWIQNHILGSDKKYASFFNDHGLY